MGGGASKKPPASKPSDPAQPKDPAAKEKDSGADEKPKEPKAAGNSEKPGADKEEETAEKSSKPKKDAAPAAKRMPLNYQNLQRCGTCKQIIWDIDGVGQIAGGMATAGAPKTPLFDEFGRPKRKPEAFELEMYYQTKPQGQDVFAQLGGNPDRNNDVQTDDLYRWLTNGTTDDIRNAKNVMFGGENAGGSGYGGGFGVARYTTAPHPFMIQAVKPNDGRLTLSAITRNKQREEKEMRNRRRGKTSETKLNPGETCPECNQVVWDAVKIPPPPRRRRDD